jgi:(p)ppGpp synthase/HD superfamily hydrolase
MALLLQRFGFDNDELLAAALLHDVVEDTACTLADLAAAFPPAVVATVAALSERKHDQHGARRPWRDRKQEHIAHIRSAPFAARVVALADKLHNLLSVRYDLDVGEGVWARFNAPRSDIEWYHRTMIDAACQDDPRLAPLADACRDVLDTLP